MILKVYLISFRSWQQDSRRSFRLRGFSAQSRDAPSESFGSSLVSLQILQSPAGAKPFTVFSRILKPYGSRKKKEKPGQIVETKRDDLEVSAFELNRLPRLTMSQSGRGKSSLQARIRERGNAFNV